MIAVIHWLVVGDKDNCVPDKTACGRETKYSDMLYTLDKERVTCKICKKWLDKGGE